SMRISGGTAVPLLSDGSFSQGGFVAGTYRVELRAGEATHLAHRGKVILADTDLDGLELKDFIEARLR
ncbi:MAG: hypothetical protein GY946_30670, partial [bacterium]|nr:hypothetical protein [bacterium]